MSYVPIHVGETMGRFPQHLGVKTGLLTSVDRKNGIKIEGHATESKLRLLYIIPVYVYIYAIPDCLFFSAG
jgi:hypothetical protein